MTPLQALEQLTQQLNNSIMGKKVDIDVANTVREVLRQALTPPTSDEVCEAIKEDTGYEMEYKDNMFVNVNGIVRLTYGRKIKTNLSLTPTTFTLIGRFYESL